jgi:DNA (cytosine-5)-methyltransferase 1
MPFDVIDLFAGPGGLGEGFVSLNHGQTFKIAVSAEMESSAHATLTLRSFFRHVQGDTKALAAYYAFCNDANAPHPRTLFHAAWAAAQDEARQLTLGLPEHNAKLDQIIAEKKLSEETTILIGGPPCQAYSLVGRSRNLGKANYVAEKDHRHFLYREYLRILHKTRPAVFVMENVKGILSAKVGGKRIFHEILCDLTDPAKALGVQNGIKYTLHSLVSPVKFEPGMDPESVDAKDFIVHSEQYGIPQARHRVILLGVRQDRNYASQHLLKKSGPLHVREALKDFGALRSKLGRDDSPEAWRETVNKVGLELAANAVLQDMPDIASKLQQSLANLRSDQPTGAVRYAKVQGQDPITAYQKWVQDPELRVWLNHETRSHMKSDLGRYLYASVFTQLHGYSPKGHQEFALNGLAPAHANWKTGKFADRFRVQRYDAPSSTITSHIAKDGHYFIHPDPSQCRSLTVREAARLQTFPDNYFFQGNRTHQYHQVGNAVPPFLASQIAYVVETLLGRQARDQAASIFL